MKTEFAKNSAPAKAECPETPRDISRLEETLHELSNLVVVARYSAEAMSATLDCANNDVSKRMRDLVLALDSILALVEESRNSETSQTPSDLVDINDIILDSLKVASSLLDGRVKTSLSLSSGLQRIRLNRGDGMRLMLNIILNAFEACNGPEPLIEISSDRSLGESPAGAGCLEHGRKPSTSSTVHIAIRDNGGGMPRSTLRRIFEPRFSTKGIRGSGLGMVIVKSIIDRCCGHVRICSEPHAGTTVDLCFPAADHLSPLCGGDSRAQNGQYNDDLL